MSGLKEEIFNKLTQALQPEVLEVEDVSEKHRGHAGFQEGGESHFDLVIEARALAGKSRLVQHRAIYAAIGPEIMGRIHALAIDVRR